MNSSKTPKRDRPSARIGALCSLILALGMVPLASGCGGGGRPPKALSPAEIPAAMDQAFQGADGELRQVAADLAEAVEGGEDSRAFVQLQTLLNRPDLTPEQRDVVSRSLITIGARLNEAAEAGDAAATRLMETHGALK